MKVLPKPKAKRQSKDPELSHLQTVTRIIALVLAFISVFVFFFKILFF